MRKRFVFLTAILVFFFLNAGCTSEADKTATISPNSDSSYVKTFEDLFLGILFDFEITLYDADERWVSLWVEEYTNGTRTPDPLVEISYGNNPSDVEEGKLGFGMINPDAASPLFFLYGPSFSTQASEVDWEVETDMLSSWDYAFDEEVELELGETIILAAYRETTGNSIQTADLTDEDRINQMIEEEDHVLLLKMKVEESDTVKHH